MAETPMQKFQSNPHETAFKFLQLNKDIYSDHPYNTKKLIDEKDIIAANLMKEKVNRWLFISMGLMGVTISFTGLVWYKNTHLTNLQQIITILPNFISPLPYAWVLNQRKVFCYYILSKYEKRGLNDEQLSEYHRRRSLREI